VAAYLIALPVKNVVAWLLNWRFVTRFRVPWWQTAVAPLLAATVVYLILRYLGGLIWGPTLERSLALFLVGTIPALPLYCFWNAFFGGWDNSGLVELRRATEMTPFYTLANSVAFRLAHVQGLLPTLAWSC